MARARINIRPRNPKLPLFRFLEWLAVVISVVLVLVLILFVMMTPVVIQDKSVNELDRGDLVFADRFGKFISHTAAEISSSINASVLIPPSRLAKPSQRSEG